MIDPPLSSERAAKRRVILEAAVQTFAENGFLASRTRDIAERAGVAEGTIYLYFESKEELLLTAFREKVNEFVESARTLIGDTRPFRERLEQFIAMQLASIEGDPALATVLLLESRQTSRFYGGAVRDVLRTYAAAIDQLLDGGVKQGEVRPDLDIPIARRMLVGTLEEVELNWLLSDRTRPLRPLAPQVAATLFHGLSAHPRP